MACQGLAQHCTDVLLFMLDLLKVILCELNHPQKGHKYIQSYILKPFLSNKLMFEVAHLFFLPGTYILYMDVSENSGTPQIIHFNRGFPL